MATDIDRTSTIKGGYPLMLASYLLACEKYSDSATASTVKGYLTYVVSSAGQQAAASAAGSAPLDSSLSQKASAIVAKIGS
jgi:phosphate transport system substrate-binding protein